MLNNSEVNMKKVVFLNLIVLVISILLVFSVTMGNILQGNHGTKEEYEIDSEYLGNDLSFPSSIEDEGLEITTTDDNVKSVKQSFFSDWRETFPATDENIVNVLGTAESRNSPWPSFGGDRKNSGQSPYDTSHVDGREQWSFETDSKVISSPVIAEDGTVYVSFYDGNVYAINPDGTEKWRFNAGHRITSSPALGLDGTIYIGSWDNIIYAINSDGTERWNITMRSTVTASPNIGEDGTIYIGGESPQGNDYLFAFDPDGTEKWRFETGTILKSGSIRSSPAIGDDGTIYVGTSRCLYAIYQNGTRKWRFETYGGVWRSPVIGNDGTIYFNSIHRSDGIGRFYAVNPDGTERWSFETKAYRGGTEIIPSPAVGADGTVYYSSGGGILAAFYPEDGSLKWHFPENGLPLDDNVVTSPSIGGDGTIYFGTQNRYDDTGKLYALDAEGTERWNFTTGGGIWSSPAIGEDGTIYFGSTDGNVYAIGGQEKTDDIFSVVIPLAVIGITIGVIVYHKKKS